MRIEKLEFVKNIDKFENNSDEYVEINLNRKRNGTFKRFV